MQELYAYNTNPDASVAQVEADLDKSVKACHELFVWLFCLLPEIAFYRLKKLESLKEKYNPTDEDLNPNMRFVENAVIQQIEQSKQLKALTSDYKVNWDDESDLVAKLFHQIEEMPEYEAYMKKENSSYKSDKTFVLQIVEKIFANNDLLHWYMGEKNLHWISDYDEAVTMLYQNISAFKKDEDNNGISPIYGDDEAKEFCHRLFRLTLSNAEEYTNLIDSKLQNWELDRIMNMDMLLMQMALCEFLEFPLIPIKVTLNEYIEIAKWYSSDKSKVFINGILDRLIVDLRNENRINKTGRGLYQD